MYDLLVKYKQALREEYIQRSQNNSMHNSVAQGRTPTHEDIENSQILSEIDDKIN